MRGDLLTLTVILLLLVVSVQPNPAPQLRSWYRLSRLFNGLLSLGGAEKTVEEAEDDIQDVPPQDYQVLQSYEVKRLLFNFGLLRGVFFLNRKNQYRFPIRGAR